MKNDDWLLKDPMCDYEVPSTIDFNEYDDSDKSMTPLQVVVFGIALSVVCITVMMTVFVLLTTYVNH